MLAQPACAVSLFCLFSSRWVLCQRGARRLNVSLFVQGSRVGSWKRWAIRIQEGHQDGSENWQYKLTLFGGNQDLLVGELESPRHSLCACTGCSGVALPAHWMQSWEKKWTTCQGLSGRDACTEEAWAITPAIWQLRNPSGETRPSLKCELYHFSKLYVARMTGRPVIHSG